MSIAVSVAIYIRVSTEEQAKEGFSIAAQKERLTSFSHSQGWDIFDFYIDEGLSAKDMNRPELQRMLDDIRAGHIKIILTYKLDRLTRSIVDLYEILQSLERYGVGFKSATESLDTTTPMGRAMIGIIGIFAQLERENLAERVRFGMEQMVREGRWHGQKAPFGYDINNKSLAINEEEAHWVRRIFEMFTGGSSYWQISLFLDSQGVVSKNNLPLSEKSIQYILSNPVYIGNLRWNTKKDKQDDYFEAEDVVPQIIDKEVFQFAQQIIKSRSSLHPKEKKSEYIFSGLLRCARCGLKMTGSTSSISPRTGQKYRYYKCKGKVGHRCDMKLIREDVVEKQFINQIKYLREETAIQEVAATAKEVDENVQSEIERINRELSKLKNNKRKWQRAYADGVIDLKDLKELTNEDREREKELTELLESLTKTSDGDLMSPEEIAKLLVSIEDNWKQADVVEKKNMAMILIKEMSLDVQGDRVLLSINFN